MRRLCFVAVLLCLVVGAFCQITTCNNVILGQQPNTVSLTGTLLRNRNDEDFCNYSNIRYATPPIGDLRFKDPEALPSPFPNNLDPQRPASMGPYTCVQQSRSGIIGDEDCLLLNVFTRRTSTNTATTTNLPVMVWIHGGMFKTGSANSDFHNPEFLLSQNVILVTINYRLNVFGFTAFDDSRLEIPGNAGLKDQVLALRWIRENINLFGGNPDSVTLFGQGAGAVSAHYHVLSPMSRGLFHRVILQSGTALSPTVGGLRNSGMTIAHELSLNVTNRERMVETLRIIPAEHLVLAHQRLLSSALVSFGSMFGPVIEPESNVTASFLIDDPFNLIDRAEYNAVPMMIGYNDAEGIAFQMLIPSDLTVLIPNDLAITQSNRLQTVRQEIQNFYFPNLNITLNGTGRILMYTDAWFGFPAVRTATLHARTTTQNIFLYRFSADTALNVFKRNSMVTIDLPGASHEDDIGYLFKTRLTPDINPHTPESFAINRMVNLWTNFARGTAGDTTVEFTWTQIGRPAQDTPARIHFADIGTLVSTMGENPDPDRITFWTGIYDRHFRRPSSAITAKGFMVLTVTLSLFNLVI